MGRERVVVELDGAVAGSKSQMVGRLKDRSV